VRAKKHLAHLSNDVPEEDAEEPGPAARPALLRTSARRRFAARMWRTVNRLRLARGDGRQTGGSLTKREKNTASAAASAATVGYEAEQWRMADALRGSMNAAEYKRVVLGLIFLKYISDAFEERHARVEAERDQGADPEDPDEYRAVNVFWVPPEARWQHLKAQARQPTIGQLVDDRGGERLRDDNLAWVTPCN